jgi:hypothetical protein
MELSWKKKGDVRKTEFDDVTYVIKPKGDEFRVYMENEKKSVFQGTLDLCKSFVQSIANDTEEQERIEQQSKIIDVYAEYAWKHGRDWHLVHSKRKTLLKQAGLTRNQITDHIVRVSDRRVDERLREKFREHNMKKNRPFVAFLNGSLCLNPGDEPSKRIEGHNIEQPQEEHNTPKKKGPVERDRWGAKIGSGSAAINAVLSSKWKTAKTIQKEAQTDRNVSSHLATLVREGKVKKAKGKKSGETIYKLASE